MLYQYLTVFNLFHIKEEENVYSNTLNFDKNKIVKQETKLQIIASKNCKCLEIVTLFCKKQQ